MDEQLEQGTRRSTEKFTEVAISSCNMMRVVPSNVTKMDSDSDACMSDLPHTPVPPPDQPANHPRDTQQATAGEEGPGYGVAGSVDSDVLVFETLVSDNITLILQCQNLQIIDASTTSKLSSGLSTLQTYFHQASEELKTRLAANVVRQPVVLGTIWDFSTNIYQSMFL